MDNLTIIVPYRNREMHLKKFIPHMNNFLKNKINYKLVIVEQNNDKPFNRAKLLNVGFLENQESNYFCFHDIDMLPTDENCNYAFVDGVCKLSYYVSQFNFIPRPDTELGGVTLIDKQNFIKVNGYSNEYWGWGVEDEDFATRCKIKNVSFSVRKGRYLSLFHKPNGDTYGDTPSVCTIKNREYYKSLNNNLFDSGINNIDYKIIEKNENNDFILIKADI
jgi:predicted glycosyltransferase involved in capsule biosynthesis